MNTSKLLPTEFKFYEHQIRNSCKLLHYPTFFVSLTRAGFSLAPEAPAAVKAEVEEKEEKEKEAKSI